MSVNSKMTAIADAIRAHTGGTDALTLDAMAEAIAGLEVGGGLEIKSGSFTLSEDLSTYRFALPVNFLPTTILVFIDPLYRFDLVSGSFMVGFVSEDSFLSYGANSSTAKEYGFYKTLTGSSISFQKGTFGKDYIVCDGSNVQISLNSENKLQSGKKYVWVAIGGESR